jgi:hypothetical protein
LRFLFHRRPAAATVISLIALFVSLGGAGYAAGSLPGNSVGSSQLQNNAVSYKKIVPGAVGMVRANTNQLQARVSGTCGLYSGIGAIEKTGKVECLPSLPPQAGVVNTVTVPVPSTLTIVNNLLLQRAGSYLAWANPTATVTGNGTSQRVTVSCTLTVGAGNTQTRSATINTGTSTAASSASIPLQLAGSSGDSGVNCASSSSANPAASVSVTSALNAIETSS